jgi:hypothetical protein
MKLIAALALAGCVSVIEPPETPEDIKHDEFNTTMATLEPEVNKCAAGHGLGRTWFVIGVTADDHGRVTWVGKAKPLRSELDPDVLACVVELVKKKVRFSGPLDPPTRSYAFELDAPPPLTDSSSTR